MYVDYVFRCEVKGNLEVDDMFDNEIMIEDLKTVLKMSKKKKKKNGKNRGLLKSVLIDNTIQIIQIELQNKQNEMQ